MTMSTTPEPSPKRKQHFVNPDTIKKRKKFSKHVWTEEEDHVLRNAVQRINKTNTGIFWSKVAEELPGRIGRQCRDRWVNHLRPKVNKEVWTEEEDKMLFDAIKVHGTQWAEIARLQILPGRTDLSLKNRYYSCLRKEERNKKSNRPLHVKIEDDISTDDMSEHSDVIQLSSILLSMQSSPVRRIRDRPNQEPNHDKENQNNADKLNSQTQKIAETTNPFSAFIQQPPFTNGFNAELAGTFLVEQMKKMLEKNAKSSHIEPATNAVNNSVIEHGFNEQPKKQNKRKPLNSTNRLDENNIPKTYANGRTVSGAYPGTENTGRWSQLEHEKFIEGMMKYGRNNWTAIANVVKTRTVVQVRTHAQKFYKRLRKSGTSEFELPQLNEGISA